MIPWVVARELRATLLDYLRSTWGMGDARDEAALFQFLSGPNGLFQGPYLRLALPFATAPADAKPPLDVVPPYAPHLHQLQAWQRLSSRGQQPHATLITTGTGSGKTECFLYPLLDHARRAVERGQGGIKAIVLYPMNALASDQAQRFAETIWNEERLRGKVRVGLFVGGKGQHADMGRDHVVDINDRLRAHPPDILLTNYRMLDLLLQRPGDASLWAQNAGDTLQYLVLDELHTYDGAQGTDVACLIRRLGQRLGSSETLCPIGTSATVAGGDDTRGELLKFAGTLFDQTFPDDAFIGETRVEPRELIGEATEKPLAETYPTEPGPWPEAGEDAADHVRVAVEAWFPAEAKKAILAKGALDRVALGTWIRRLPIVRALLTIAHRRPLSSQELLATLGRELPGFAAGSQTHREGWLASALSLVSFAQRDVAGRALPFVNVQATLWIREVRRLLSRVGTEPAYCFYDDSPPPEGEVWIPPYSCSDCGHGGWLVTESGPGDELGFKYKDIARAYLERRPTLRLLHTDVALEDHDGSQIAWLDAKTKRFLEKDPGTGAPRVAVVEPEPEKMARCPACDGRGTIRMVAARSTTLSSVAVGHLFTTPLNTDRKLLTFSDSVQDAAHRAGFFGARTFRFVIRTAILAAVPHEGSIKLAHLGDATWALWQKKLGLADATATLLPPDLDWLASVSDWHARLDDFVNQKRQAEENGEQYLVAAPAPPAPLIADLDTRIQWEAVREVGVATRIGRTLEQTGCLAVTVEAERFERAVENIHAVLPERVRELKGVAAASVRGCIAGLLTRLRLRGGVWNDLLRGYVDNGGDSFFLTKKKSPLLSPFPPQTSKPLLLTNAPKARRFDSVAGTRRQSWALDWLERSLGIELDPGTSAAAYAVILPVLAREGILTARPTSEKALGGQATAWALLADSLEVSRRHVFRRCDTCGYELAAVDASVTDPVGHVCLRYRCKGHFRALVAKDSWHELAGLPSARYYQRAYERGQLGRLWSKEHTGLLTRTAREDLELEFKQRPRPDSPNLLSCTPTLEMGIDIGDLSATLLCSVPPGTSNYVQRVGRAGRKTGNALVLAFAATRPHDLYFFQQPLEAMAGAIHPPGCYLSAPEVLKRQAIAFCFDAFARDGGKLPTGVKEALTGDDAKRFPKPVVEYVQKRRVKLRDAFVEMFRGALTPTARKLMEEMFEPQADGATRLESILVQTTDRARERREELKRLAQKLDERRKQLATDDVEAKKVVDLEDEKRRLVDERKFVQQQLEKLLYRDVWGWLCEESVLPNYAFPERGVKLDAFIRREGGGEPEHHEWVRAPASALTELAPFNTFYASARRVPITGVELKREASPTEWSFCRSCHHAEPRSATATAETNCPKCGDGGWGDLGLRRTVLQMAQVYAVASHRDAVLGDDADDRERQFYQRLSLFEAESEAREAWANEAAGFGFELQPRLVLRELNLGLKDNGSPQMLTIAGQLVPDVHFLLCEVCGQAQRTADQRRTEVPPQRHRAWCPERKKPDDKQRSRQLHLLRQLTSEALRLVVPTSDAEDVTTQLANLRAGLRVGLRRFYGGEPDFLDVRVYDEPLPGKEGRRRYLVVMDRVPGGTGLLAELALDKGAKLKEALVHAQDTLRRCDCQRRQPAVRACYQCLYAYREGEDLPLLDRQRALELIERLIDAFDTLTRVDTIGTMTQSSVLESELEHRFLTTLRTRIEADGGTWKQEDAASWKLQVGARKWLIRAQVTLGADQVAHPCRADFVLYPEEKKGARPIAVFTDGLAFHVAPGNPQARLGDDATKRLGISLSENMLTWSLTWKDVVSPDEPPIPKWFGDGTPWQQLQQMVMKLDTAAGAKGDRVEQVLRVLDADPLRALIAVLGAPRALGQLARVTAFSLLQRGRRQADVAVGKAHDRLCHDAVAADLAIDAAVGEVVVSQVSLGEHARLLLDLPASRIGSLLKDHEGLRLTLRLEDDAERRGLPSYETSWRLWLRAWNLLQALPGAVLVTSESASPSILTDARRVAKPVAPTTRESAPLDANDPRILRLAELTDEAARVVIGALLGKHAHLPAPEIPFEVRKVKMGIGDDDLELAWPDHKVAAYFDPQKGLAEALTAKGWTVFALERGLNLAALEDALKLEG